MSAPEELRQGIFLPDLEDMSKEWLAAFTTMSTQWQDNFEHLARLLQEVLAELKSLQGLTVRIDREAL